MISLKKKKKKKTKKTSNKRKILPFGKRNKQEDNNISKSN